MQVLGAKCRVELFSNYMPVEIKHLFTNAKGNPFLYTRRLNKASNEQLFNTLYIALLYRNYISMLRT